VTGAGRRTFPLVPRRPLVGTVYGTQRSLRRGPGAEIAGSRPYQPGDRLSAIDWNASARLSAFRDSDEFIVRQTFAEDAPKVVVVCDLRPEMALYPPGLPFFSKRDATRQAVEAITASALAARAELGWLDVAQGVTTWLAPHSTSRARLVERRLGAERTAAPADLALALAQLARRVTEAPAGTFVFVISDFLEPSELEQFRPLLGRRLDLVPVIVRDPVWESSFPDVAGVLLPVADASGSRRAGVRLSSARTAERRAANEARAADVERRLRAFGVDFVALGSAGPVAVDAAFAAWAARRRAVRRWPGAL
jgi:uncharacterized protein (DUF58 family)